MINFIEQTEFTSPVRRLDFTMELLNGSIVENTFYSTDSIKSIKVERAGIQDKFFGYGICQKANIKLIDKDRYLDITTAHSFAITYVGGSSGGKIFPTFYATETNRDEITNELSITTYDKLYDASHYTVADLELEAPYTPRQFIEAIATKLEIDYDLSEVEIDDYTSNLLAYYYEQGANYNGTETLRDALDDLAEVLLAIYYINYDDKLVFKRIRRDGDAALTITKEDYIDLDSKTNRRLSAICSATELGDNFTASTGLEGTTQFIRDNPFWDLREDRDTQVEDALSTIGNLVVNQFDMNWRGNLTLELGDKIDLITKDNQTVSSFLLNDTVEYDGSLRQKSDWKFEDKDTETASNPTGLGDIVKNTYAKVDKIGQTVDLVVSDVDGNRRQINQIVLDKDEIKLSVSALEKQVGENTEDLADVKKATELILTEEEVRIIAREEKVGSAGEVITEAGFTFDNTGLTIDRVDGEGNRIGETSTLITENGMTILDTNDDAVLTANNQGVNAKNLHATTYLIIGKYSRFEDYDRDGQERTGCFWIGG